MSHPFPSKVEELPKKKFYALLQDRSVAIPGDERSRSNPGHGYPGYNLSHMSWQTFDTPQELLVEVEKIMNGRFGTDVQRQQSFLAVEVQPYAVNLHTTVALTKVQD